MLTGGSPFSGASSSYFSPPPPPSSFTGTYVVSTFSGAALPSGLPSSASIASSSNIWITVDGANSLYMSWQNGGGSPNNNNIYVIAYSPGVSTVVRHKFP